MDDLNPDNESNKVYETEPGVGQEATGFSAQAQKDKFLEGSMENNNGQESGELSLTDKTLSFFGRLRERHMGATTISISGVPATIGQFLANGPEAGIITAGLLIVAAVALEKSDRNIAKYDERMAQRLNQTDNRTHEISNIPKTK